MAISALPADQQMVSKGLVVSVDIINVNPASQRIKAQFEDQEHTVKSYLC